MKRPPRQVRLEEETDAEIKKIADVTNLPEIEIIRQTIRAGVDAIVENGYKLPLPLKLAIKESPSTPGTFPPRQVTHHELNDSSSTQKTVSSEPPGMHVEIPAAKYHGKSKPPRQK